MSGETSNILMDHDRCPDLRKVQADILTRIKAEAEAVGAALYYADLVLTPMPLLWFCGTEAEAVSFTQRIQSAGYGIATVVGSRTVPFSPDSEQAHTGLVFADYRKDGVKLHGSTSGVEIEFCRYNPDNASWRARRARIESEADADYLAGLDPFDYLGVTLPILRNAHAVWERHPARDKIDIVYTWVDGADPAWQARKAGIDHAEEILGANTAARFESGKELFYSIVSAQRYFGDLGHIYVVTDNQTPVLPDEVMAQVTIVDHREIFEDPAHLPTFNSHAIGAQLHRIPGLRRHFLYLNDDVLFGRPTAASTFYDELGRSYQFHSTAVSTPHTKVGALESAVNAAARNNRRLLQEKLGLFAFRKFKHTPVPLDREVMERMRAELPEAWEATLPNKFRSPQDHAIAGHLYAHYAAHLGRSLPGSIRYAYFDLGHPDFVNRFDIVLRRDRKGPDVFCVNETLQTPETATNRAHMDRVFASIFARGAVQQIRAKSPRGPEAVTLRRIAKRFVPPFARTRLRNAVASLRARRLRDD